MMQPEFLQWVGPIGTLISIGTAIWVWVTSPAKAAAAAAAAVAERVNSVERRLDKVELEIEHMPDAQAIQDLAIGIANMRGDIKTLASQVLTAVAVSERLQNWLLEQSK